MTGSEGEHPWIARSGLLPRAAAARVLLLDAPGGWGKTTFAEQVIEAFGRGAVRVRLTDDCSVDGLVAACGRALKRAGVPELAETLRGDSNEQLDGLLGGLRARPDGLVIFVDEVHFLDHDGAVWLRALADDIAAPHGLIVAGRGIDRALTRRLRADVVWTTIADLRFTVTEIAHVAGVDGDAAAALLERTDGWPAAVGLAAMGGLSVAVGAGFGDLGALLDNLLGDDRERLATLAVPPLLSREVCEIAAGPRAFERLAESGLPTRAVGEWRALADPVRDVLRSGARLTVAQATAIAALYDLPNAVAFLAAIDELDVLAEVAASRHWTELLDLSVGEVGALISVLGDERVVRVPRLLLVAARAAELRVPLQRTAWVERGLAVAPAGPLHRAFRAEAVRDLARNAVRETADVGYALLAELSAVETETRARTLLSVGVAQGTLSTPESLDAADRSFTEACGVFRLLGETRLESEALSRMAFMVN